MRRAPGSWTRLSRRPRSPRRDDRFGLGDTRRPVHTIGAALGLVGLTAFTGWAARATLPGTTITAGDLNLVAGLTQVYEVRTTAAGGFAFSDYATGVELLEPGQAEPAELTLALTGYEYSRGPAAVVENALSEPIGAGSTYATVQDFTATLIGDNLTARLDISAGCPDFPATDAHGVWLYADLNGDGLFGDDGAGGGANEQLVSPAPSGGPGAPAGTLAYLATGTPAGEPTTSFSIPAHFIGESTEVAFRLVTVLEIPADYSSAAGPSEPSFGNIGLELTQVRAAAGYPAADAEAEELALAACPIWDPQEPELPDEPPMFHPEIRLTKRLVAVNNAPYTMGAPVTVGDGGSPTMGLFEFTISNAGDTALTDIVLTDAAPSGASGTPVTQCDGSPDNMPQSLEPSESVTCSLLAEIAQNAVFGDAIDIYENRAVVTATSGSGAVTTSDLLRVPAITALQDTRLCQAIPAGQECYVTLPDGTLAIDSDCDGYSDAEEMAGTLNQKHAFEPTDPCDREDSPQATPCSFDPAIFPDEFAVQAPGGGVAEPRTFNWLGLRWDDYLANIQWFDWDGDLIDDQRDEHPCDVDYFPDAPCAYGMNSTLDEKYRYPDGTVWHCGTPQPPGEERECYDPHQVDWDGDGFSDAQEEPYPGNAMCRVDVMPQLPPCMQSVNPAYWDLFYAEGPDGSPNVWGGPYLDTNNLWPAPTTGGYANLTWEAAGGSHDSEGNWNGGPYNPYEVDWDRDSVVDAADGRPCDKLAWPPRCPTGQDFNSSSGRCECAAGFTFNVFTGACEADDAWTPQQPMSCSVGDSYVVGTDAATLAAHRTTGCSSGQGTSFVCWTRLPMIIPFTDPSQYAEVEVHMTIGWQESAGTAFTSGYSAASTTNTYALAISPGALAFGNPWPPPGLVPESSTGRWEYRVNPIDLTDGELDQEFVVNRGGSGNWATFPHPTVMTARVIIYNLDGTEAMHAAGDVQVPGYRHNTGGTLPVASACWP